VRYEQGHPQRLAGDVPTEGDRTPLLLCWELVLLPGQGTNARFCPVAGILLQEQTIDNQHFTINSRRALKKQPGIWEDGCTLREGNMPVL